MLTENEDDFASTPNALRNVIALITIWSWREKCNYIIQMSMFSTPDLKFFKLSFTTKYSVPYN
ncbi:hypothetical protein PPNK14_38800 [Pectobacterium parmentieri]